MKPLPIRAVFMGTPEFSVPCLRALMANIDLVQVVGVYTQPDRPAGRGQKLTASPVKLAALEYGIPVYQPENINSPEEKTRFFSHLADIAIVVAYAQFLGKAILNTPRLGCINVHSSLLPKFRGAAPIQYTILEGEKEAGVTIIKLISKMDAGPMLVQKKISLDDKIRGGELTKILSHLGAEALIEALELIQERKVIEKEQNEDLVSFAPKIRKEDGLISWDKSGQKIICQIRALDPWPGTYARTSKGVIKIHEAKFHGKLNGVETGSEDIGAVKIVTGSLFVRCLDGWLELLKVQPEGKKPMLIRDFLNGINQASELEIS